MLYGNLQIFYKNIIRGAPYKLKLLRNVQIYVENVC